ncbi:MAG: DUF1749 domain-containing protein [Oscillospiraceae bacterium]|nr:DUF1749 domain-containing protein [Oscillospiraceae bacterium]
MNLERIYFVTEDNVELSGLLATPHDVTHEVIISVHGMQSNCLKKREDIIGRKTAEKGIAYFAFNNRGSELMGYVKRIDGEKKLEGGSSYENIYDSYYDIKGAIRKMLLLGYTKIHLQGHSLGCTKVIYTYNKLKEQSDSMLENVESVILLSLVDLQGIQKFHVGEQKYFEFLEHAKAMEIQGLEKELMPKESFVHPISVKTYLTYYGEGNDLINFTRFDDKYYHFKEINNIDVPLFLRWRNCL